MTRPAKPTKTMNLSASGMMRKLALARFCWSTGGDLGSRWRLARSFFRLAGSHERFDGDAQMEIRSCLGGTRPMRLTLRDHPSDVIIFREIFFDREYQACAELGFQPKSIYDIGANVGLAAAYFRARWPEAVIVGFEPADDEFAIAERNYARLGAARLFHAAAGSRDGEIAFETHPDLSGGQRVVSEASASLPPEEGWQRVQVRVRRLDSMIDRCELPKPDLIKIDVEGHEVEVLEGLGRYLSEARGVLLETHSDELHRRCLDRLIDAGFDVEDEFERGGDARVVVAQRQSPSAKATAKAKAEVATPAVARAEAGIEEATTNPTESEAEKIAIS